MNNNIMNTCKRFQLLLAASMSTLNVHSFTYQYDSLTYQYTNVEQSCVWHYGLSRPGNPDERAYILGYEILYQYGVPGPTRLDVPSIVYDVDYYGKRIAHNVIGIEWTSRSGSVHWTIYNDSIKTLTIPDSVIYIEGIEWDRLLDATSIDNPLFDGYDMSLKWAALDTVELGKSFGSFWKENNDDDWYNGYDPQDHIGAAGACLFKYCENLTRFSVSSANDALKSYGGALYSNKYGYYANGIPIADEDGEKSGRGNLTTLLLCPRGRASIEIKADTVTIGKHAFHDCGKLTNVIIPDTVTRIEDYAFVKCTNLVSIVLPDSVEFIGKSAFADCTRLSRVEFPEAIGMYTDVYQSFSGCTNLSEIVFRGIPNFTNAACFEDARTDCVVYVPRYSAGWGVNIPGTWNGLRIEYIVPQSCKHNRKTSIINRMEATCTDAGYSGDSVCYLCGEIMESGMVIPAVGHKTGAGVVTKEPTVSEAGVMSYYCTRCGTLMKTESISTLDISQVLCDCLGGLPYGSVTLGSAEVQWRRDGEITHNGKGSLGLTGNGDNSESSIRFTIRGAGQLSYWWRISSEYDAEDNSVYDYAYLTVDGEDQGGKTDDCKLFGYAIGGDTDWTNVVIDINGAGDHTIVWTYKKDEVDEIAGFEDCVWIENVIWRPMVSATFELGGGAGSVSDSVDTLSGTTITLPTAEGFGRDGYVFAGWSDGVYLYAAGDSYKVGDSNVVFTATWIRMSILTFALGDGTGALPTAIHEIPGRVVSLPGSNGIEREGYVFAGWSDGLKTYAAGESYTLGSSDVVFTATWTRKSILTFALNGGTGDVPAAIMVIPATVVALPSASGFRKPKHAFVGWSDGSKIYLENSNYTVKDIDVEFTALWTAKTISKPTIQSPNVANGGVVTDAASVTLTLSADEGATLYYTLDGSTPTAESPQYDGPLTFTDYAVTIKAIALRDDYFDSEIAEFFFTRKPYTLAECLGLGGISDAVVSTGGDGEAWHRISGDESHDGTAGLRSGAIKHNQTNWVEVCVNGAGTLSFWWKASSETVRGKVRDGLSFFVDGELRSGPIGGPEGDWARVSYAVAEEGLHTFRWEFGKSATDSADIGEDCAWLDDVTWIVPCKVSNVMAIQRYPWNGLVDISCNVSGIAGTATGYKFDVAAVIPDSDEVRSVSQVWVVQDGKTTTDLVVSSNGDYRLIWDARADLGEVLYSNIVVQVNLKYVVKYNPGANGIGVLQTADKTHGVALLLNGVMFTRNGYSQTGWATGDDGARAYDLGESYTANAPIALYPYWTPNIYTVTYNPGVNGSGTQQTAYQTHDVALTLNGTMFTRDGYTQTGWATSDGGAKAYDLSASYAENASIALYPYWAVNTYAVTYNPGANGCGMQQVSDKIHGVALTLNSATFTRNGYTQTGWATIDGGAKVYDLGATYIANTAVMLYPYWTPNTYMVTYNPGANGSGTQQTAYQTHDVALTLNGAMFTRNGYTQTGWATNDGGAKAYNLGASYTGNASIVFYPYWAANTYTVTYNPGVNGSGWQQTAKKIHDVALTLNGMTFTRDGYTQTGWATSDGGAKVYDIGATYTGNAPIALYPCWTEGVQLWKGGPYWATKNIGAEKKSESGCYFWWGDTVGYRRENNAWVASDDSCANFSFEIGNTPTYGIHRDSLKRDGWLSDEENLMPEHDAAHVHWGGNWRLPTYNELYNLGTKCDWTWTTVDGVKGHWVRGRGDYASAIIFLPAAGRVSGRSLYWVDKDGYYWSSSGRLVDYHDAAALESTDSYGYNGIKSVKRYYGLPIRPVQDATK